MDTLARLVVAVTDLLEAEGRAFRKHAARFLIAGGIISVVVVLALTGLACLFFGLFWLLARVMPADGAIILLGVVALVLGWIGCLWIKRILEI